MLRTELVAKAKALGIKYISKKNKQVLAEEIAAISKKTKKAPAASTGKPVNIKAKITYGDGRPYKVYARDRNTDDGLSFDERRLRYDSKPIDIIRKVTAKKLIKLVNQSKIDNKIARAQTYCIWYDRRNDTFLMVLDMSLKDKRGGWQAYHVLLSPTNEITSAKLYKEDLSGGDLSGFLGKVVGKRRLLDIYTDM